ncbi:MAG: STAS domain-containing protein [Gammaproteobacteria bacterium]|nr:STAS domain-containing protein [Gammaproteobacteria bacterium]
MSDLVSLSRGDDGVYILRGELGFITVSPLLKHSAELFSGEETEIVVDLAGITRADSAGLSLLIQWWRHALEMKRSISYVHVPAQMMAMAQLGGVDELLPIIAEG